MPERKFDLEERLIKFASDVINVLEHLPKTAAANVLNGQLARCGTAPCLQYAEAQSAESRPDFIHKMKVALKELRETFAGLKLIRLNGWCPIEILKPTLKENNELISIFVTSIDTAQKNHKAELKSNKNRRK